jgi:phage protein D
MTDKAVHTAVPYEVTIGSRVFKQPENDGLVHLVIEDHVDMVTMLTAQVGGAESQPTWEFKVGDAVVCKVGEGKKSLFEGEVISVDPGYQLDGHASVTVRALDKSHRLGRGRKTRRWNDKTDSDVVKEVGAESGLSVDCDDTGEVHGYILQRNESNIAFLKRLAARNNFLLRVTDGKLEFKKPSFQGSSVPVKMGGGLRSMRLAFNTTDMVQKVVVRGWDVKAKKEIVGMASAGDVTKIGGGEIGAQQAGTFGESVAYVTDVPVSSQAQADQVAKAEMERIARGFCRGSASVSGDDALRAGATADFSGLPTGQNGKFYIMSSRHVISARSGYTTEITFISNTTGS